MHTGSQTENYWKKGRGESEICTIQLNKVIVLRLENILKIGNASSDARPIVGLQLVSWTSNPNDEDGINWKMVKLAVRHLMDG